MWGHIKLFFFFFYFTGDDESVEAEQDVDDIASEEARGEEEEVGFGCNSILAASNVDMSSA